MKITSVSLENVKSYDETSPSINFQSGVNAIIGENGSGKSTLCEAIGFALFDFLHPYSQADFVREGKNTGKVSIIFESDRSHELFRVERGVGQSKYDVFNVKKDEKVPLQGKEEVTEWLKQELGVPSSMDLQTLWKSSLGVPQGKFTNDFAETPSIRAQLFNPLLEVDVYRTLWKKMKHVTDVFINQQQNVSEKIAGLEPVEKELPDLEQRVKEKTNQINNAKKTVSTIKEKISTIEEKKNKLESIKKELETISQKLSLLNEKQKDLQNQETKTKQQYEEAQTAKTIVSKHAEQYNQFVSNEKKLSKLGEKRKKKQVIEKKRVALEKKLSQYEEQLKHVQEQIHIAEQSKKEMDDLQKKVEKQEEYEEKLETIKQKENEINRIKQDISQTQQKISNLRKEFQSLKRKISEISEKKPQAKQKTELQNQKEDFLQQRSIFSHQREEYNNVIELLQSSEKSECPTCSRPLDETHRNEIISLKQKEIKQIKKKQQQLNDELKLVETRLENAEQAEQQVKRLSDLEDMAKSIQQDAEEQKEKKQKLEKTISSVQEELSKKESILTKLKELNNPKETFQQAKTRYEDHKGKTTKRDQVKQELSSIKEEYERVSEQVKEYKELQEEINQLEGQQKSLKESYELFLQHKDAASKIEYWKKQIISLQSSRKEIEQKKKNLTEKKIQKEKEFDEKEFSNLKTDFETNKTRLTELETQIKEWIKQKKELDLQKEEKQKQKEELLQLKKKYHSLGKDIEFAGFLRETYQKSRPLITEILVEEISHEADRIYRELRGVPSEELAWKKDYEIVVYESGNKRAFHKLSGGEQMCAALAVRLAILKLLSTMDIVFLDEPTMNLDEEKKQNLVAQLRDLSGFSQIFVISHDETFESMTEHVITLEKRQGATQLMTHFQGGF